MQDDDSFTLDPRTMEAYELITNAADTLLHHCSRDIPKPYIALFGMMMAASRIAAAGNIDVKMLHQALDAMYDDSLNSERSARHEH